MRTIANYVGLLEENFSENKDEATQQYLKFITSATSRMQNLIKDLLDFSRVGKNPVFENVDCNKIINTVIVEWADSIKESNAKVIFKNLPSITAIDIEIKRLFQNLISNSIKFRKKDVAPEIIISAEEKSEEYLFSVKDNGIGISEKHIPKLFVIFQRLNPAEEYPGTGVGLVTAKKIVNLHNGKIWMESKEGEGSTFYFTTPKNISK